MKVEGYVAIGKQVWQREKSGRRRLATVATLAGARRIARLLNNDLESRRRPVARGVYPDDHERVYQRG